MGSEKGFAKFRKSKIFTLLIILIALIVIFTVLCAVIGKTFLSVDNLMSIVDSLVVTSFLAIGAGVLLITGNLDLSVIPTGCVGGLFMAVAIKNLLWPWPVALIGALVICGIFGLINALLVNEFNMQPFIATMATAMIFTGVQTFISWDAKQKLAQNIAVKNDFVHWLGSYQLFNFIPITVVIALLAFLLYGIMLRKTKFGMTIYLVGGNPQAARLSGLNPKRVSYMLFINCALMSGIAGIVLLARTGSASQLALASNMFTGLTAAILGGISFGGGSGGMLGVFVGLCILNTFTKGTAILNADALWSNLLQGVVLIIALSLDFSSSRKKTKSPKKSSGKPEKAVAPAGSSR